MATTNFVNGETVIQAAWLNDVDDVTYNVVPYIGKRIYTAPSGSSISVNADTTDIVVQVNTAAAGSVNIATPTSSYGGPIDGQKLMFKFTTTNAQHLFFSAAYRGSSDLYIPAYTTGSSKTDYLGFIYDAAAGKWNLLAKQLGY
jgi:hypothetical protein